MKVFAILWSVVIFLQVQVKGVSLPSEIELCHKSDPKFNDCIKKSLESGLRALANGYKPIGMNPIEPFHVDKIEIGGSETGPVTLNQKYENMTITGSVDSTVLNTNLDLDKCFWTIDVVSHAVVMKSNYLLKGQVLIFPINGKGACEVTLKELDIQHEIQCKRIKKKNKTYLQITDYKISLKPTSVFYDFKTVLPGNVEISKQILKAVNDNALSIFNDVRPGFEEAFAKLYTNIVNNVFSKIPENELFLE